MNIIENVTVVSLPIRHIDMDNGYGFCRHCNAEFKSSTLCLLRTARTWKVCED